MHESKKIRDIANRAFRSYAALGCPTRRELEDRIKEDTRKKHSHEPPYLIEQRIETSLLENRQLIYDIEAVDFVMSELKQKGLDERISAIRAVYFHEPRRTPHRGEMEGRVTKYAVDGYVSPRTVYSWLSAARKMFFEARGMIKTTQEEPASNADKIE